MSTLKTYHIHLSGIVQGVGFRPLVHRLANEYSLNGYVNNSNDGLHIEINANGKQALEFYDLVLQNAPGLSKITTKKIEEVPHRLYSNFEIVESRQNPNIKLYLTPDFAICDLCKAELYDPKDRRFHYPFITCTNCGPRYSITELLPFDRNHTTMQDFTMCKACNDEYHHTSNRRYYAQTNSCQNCGIQLSLYKTSGIPYDLDQASLIKTVLKKLALGKIIAVKGIGGFILMCDATQSLAIQSLRIKKHRKSKPLAVLFSDLEMLEEFAFISPSEKKMLSSVVAPIVLLKHKNNTQLAFAEIAPNNNRIGAMLPNSPLLDLIAKGYGKPLIATSANISGGTIIYKDEIDFSVLGSLADYILTHNRPISVPLDDSVITFTERSKTQIILRRGRGIGPSYFEYNAIETATMMATGAHMKSTFTISCNHLTCVSQYLGSTESFETQITYKTVAENMFKNLNLQLNYLISDLHPDYFSTSYAKTLTEQYNANHILVQHHKAHFSAVLAENNLLNEKKQVLGIIWDGTGLGDDGQIWGGEFFIYTNYEMNRAMHFEYCPQLLGDKMSKVPKLSALAFGFRDLEVSLHLKTKFSSTEWDLYNKMLLNYTGPQSTSVGRIFDAVAALLDLCEIQNYEGEAAQILQYKAEQYFGLQGYKFNESYFTSGATFHHIPSKLIIKGVMSDLKKGKTIDFIAAKFHYSLVHAVEIVASQLKINKIAFSGGVFQNALLVDLLIYHLDSKFELCFHKNLSPNDENISFGQLVYVDQKIDTQHEQTFKNSEQLTTKTLSID